MDPQTQNTSLPRVPKGVSDLELAVGVMEELASPSGKDVNSPAQQNIKENRKNVSAGVTSTAARRSFYALAISLVICTLVNSISVLWFENAGTLHKLLYVFLSAATIPYIGMLFICFRNDVPVPSYRLGAKGHLKIYISTMVVVYCLSYGFPDLDVGVEISWLVLTGVTGAIAIVQLHSPAEDFHPEQTALLILLAMGSAALGGISRESWLNLSGCLFTLVNVICLTKYHCFATDLFEQQQGERRRQRLLQPILPVSLPRLDS